jgi:hypothetical protein
MALSRSRVARPLAVLAMMAGVTTSASAQFGANLIVNGGAESGAPGTVVPGWTTTAGVTVVSYSEGGGFPTATDPGPVNRGNNLFTGGQSTAFSSMSQTLSLSGIVGLSNLIAAGQVNFTFSAYLGGFSTQSDFATFDATFFDAGGNALQTVTLGPVTVGDRNSATGLLQRIASGMVPLGADNVQFRLRMTRNEGSYDDGYGDDLSFVLSAAEQNVVPEPSSVVLLATGLGFVGLVIRRKRRTS